MSKTKEASPKKSETRARLNRLPVPEKELIKGEAEKVNGGGGLSGGVVCDYKVPSPVIK